MKKTLLILGIAFLSLTSCEKSQTYEECRIGTVSVIEGTTYTYYPEEEEVAFYLRNNCSGNIQEYRMPSDTLIDVRSFVGSEITLNQPW